MRKKLIEIYKFEAGDERIAELENYITKYLGYDKIKVDNNAITLFSDDNLVTFNNIKTLAKYVIDSIEETVNNGIKDFKNDNVDYSEFLDFSVPLRKVQHYLMYVSEGTTRDEIKNIISKDYLRYILEFERLDSLNADVINSLLNEDEIYFFLCDVLRYGCVSGIVSDLIYYCDTAKFFDKHSDEIFDLFNEYKDAYGSFPIETEINKNNLSWFAYEKVSNDLLECLENEFEDRDI